MTTQRTERVGLSHPTVVPADEQGGDDRESDRSAGTSVASSDSERCPECGRPVADHDRAGR